MSCGQRATLPRCGPSSVIAGMKTFHFHPASLLTGLALGAGVLLLTSQVSTVTFPNARVEVGPHPRDMVQIHEGQPFTVPPGKLFVLTALGQYGAPATTVMRVNGALAFQNFSAVTAPMSAIPTGFTLPPGSVIEVDDLNTPVQTGQAWGYLAER